MERTLFILRHAKSSWDEPGLDDHDRPLAPRGRPATAGDLIQRLRRVPSDTASVMIIGHNPALHILAGPVIGENGTLAVARPWGALGPGTATLTGFVRPRDLEESGVAPDPFINR